MDGAEALRSSNVVRGCVGIVVAACFVALVGYACDRHGPTLQQRLARYVAFFARRHAEWCRSSEEDSAVRVVRMLGSIARDHSHRRVLF